MPELPEVEVTRRGLVDRLVGARVLGVHTGKPLRWPLGCPEQQLVGRSVSALRRRGKYLLLDLDQGLLLLHLGMSGSLVFASNLPAAGSHDHFDLVTSRGTLRLHDPRRFGAVVFAPGEQSPEAQRLLGKLGVEPMSDQFDPVRFHAALSARSAPIKQVLLAGDLVVGVGNIYASEALFHAGIRPTASAAGLSQARVIRLHAAIQKVLGLAIEQGGSTLRNFSNVDREAGHFQREVMVYARAGQPCRVCNSTVKQLRQGQRSTFFCPRCQRA